jgi:fused signal recognition particle receptor
MLQKNNLKVLLAACDTFRAAGIEQIKTWGNRLNVPVVSSAHGADPAAVAHDAITAALSKEADYLIIDTAVAYIQSITLCKSCKKFIGL